MAKHGMHDSATYRSWRSMKNRCRHETVRGFPRYGGRGITVCDRWRESFEAFLADMGERPAGMTLDRRDPNGNYEPSNCRWSTMRTQQRNRTNNKLSALGAILIRQLHGRGSSFNQLAAAFGVSRSMIYAVVHERTWVDAVGHLGGP